MGQSEIVRRTLATFVFAAGCWMLEVFPLPITGLMVPALLTLLGVLNPKDAFAPFANSIIFLMIGGLVLGQSFKKHGLDKWIGHSRIPRHKHPFPERNHKKLVSAFMQIRLFNYGYVSSSLKHPIS